jgi:hypothetical protein
MSLSLLLDPTSSGMSEPKTQEEWTRHWNSEVSGKYLPSLPDYYSTLKTLLEGLHSFDADYSRNIVDAMQAAIKGLVIITGTRVVFDGEKAEIIHKYSTDKETRSRVVVPYYYECIDNGKCIDQGSNDFIRELLDTEDSPFEMDLTMMGLLGRQTPAMLSNGEHVCATYGRTELWMPSREERQQKPARIGSLLYIPGEAPTLQICLLHKPGVKGYSPLVHDLSIVRMLQEQGHINQDELPLPFHS